MGLIEGKIVINSWCENTVDKSDDYLSKFASVFNARSSIIKHQLLVYVLQLSKITFQPSKPNLPQFKNKSKIRFLSTHPLYLNKLLLQKVRQSLFSGNLKYEELLQFGKPVILSQNVRLLTIFEGEGGLLYGEGG